MNGCVDGRIVASLRQSWHRTGQGKGGTQKVNSAFRLFEFARNLYPVFVTAY
jgi:hypothetical protein